MKGSTEITGHAFAWSEQQKRDVIEYCENRNVSEEIFDHGIWYLVSTNTATAIVKKSVDLVNDTRGGLLDMLPRVEYESLFVR